MGYYIYMTRRKDRCDEDGPVITEDEWRALVGADPELSFNDPRDPLVATWIGSSIYPETLFDYCLGNIDTKNPDPPVIGKMLQMAEKLGAKVQGDDGEVYRSPTEFYEENLEEVRQPYRSWWARLWGG